MSDKKMLKQIDQRLKAMQVLNTFSTARTIAVCITVLAVLGTVLYFALRPKAPQKTASENAEALKEFYDTDVVGSEGEVAVYVAPELKDMISIGELQTLSYSYNAIKKVRIDHEVRYYVAYEGTVQAGVNFEEIQYDVDTENHVITVTLPPVSITNAYVKAESLDYIFEDNDYNTPDVFSQAYELCEEDLLEQAKSDKNLLNLAKVNTECEIKALIAPFINEYYPEYTLVVQSEEVTLEDVLREEGRI